MVIFMLRTLISKTRNLNKMRVLVFGGNGFIGAEAVGTLLDFGVQDVTVVNRGKSWDWDTPKTIQPRVKCIKANRDRPLAEFPELCDYVKRVYHDAVIDFSGYSPMAVGEAVKLVTGRTDMYIYISSDSVYEVCQDKQHSGPSREPDAVRPSDESERKQLRRRDSYGDDKLAGEEVIVEHCSRNQLPYVMLRLADVIGPRDSTHRFWQYQLWVEMATLCADVSVTIPKKYENRPLSFVYSKDVAALIVKILTMDKEAQAAISNEAYNLACAETKTLTDLIQTIGQLLRQETKKFNILCSGDEEVPQVYPSVERGPVDITKAIEKLKWSATPLDNCIAEIVQFYKDVSRQELFPSERKDVYRDLKESLEDILEKKTVKKYLKEILRLN